jgi:plasmid stabilization system protein ParE
MIYSLIFNIEAENEFIAAYKWYEEQQEGLCERFQQETEDQIQKIIANPFVYHISKGSFRESLVPHFPFMIVYILSKKKKTVHISAIFHTSRNLKNKYRK